MSVNKYFSKLSASVRTVGFMRTTGKRVKKTMYFAVILLVLAGTLCGCSDIVNKQPLYVYGFGLDTREAGVMLYVLCGEGGGNSGGSSGSSGNSGNSGGRIGSRLGSGLCIVIRIGIIISRIRLCF